MKRAISGLAVVFILCFAITSAFALDFDWYPKVSGYGDDVKSKITVGDGLYRVHFTNTGSSNFAVWVYDSDGNRDLAVNEIGNYDGYYFLTGDGPYTFEIESKGSWSYQIESLSVTSKSSFSGKGCYVTDLFENSSAVWRFTHDGSSNFAVWLYSTNGRDLLINEIGRYDGKKILNVPSDSYAILVIEADGYWSAIPQ